MADVEGLLGVGLGGTSILGLVGYLVYKWRSANCASHMKFGDTELKIDVNKIQEVIEEATTPEQREQIRKEVQEDLKKTLHKVKSRLVNKLEQVKEKNKIPDDIADCV